MSFAEAMQERMLEDEYLESGGKEAAEQTLANLDKKKKGPEQKEDSDDVIDQKIAEDGIKTAETDTTGVLEKVKGSTAFIEETLDNAGPEIKQQYLMAKTGSSNTFEDPNEHKNQEASIDKIQQ